MDFIDIFLGVLLAYGVFKGIKNGLIVELASLISFFVGIYIAVKFSSVVGSFLGNSKSARVFSFILTFIIVVILIYFLAKMVSKIANALFLGLINRVGGAVFGLLKTALILGVILSLLQKVNINDALISKETQKNSLFYEPILKSAEFMLPVLSDWYDHLQIKKGLS